MDPKKERKGNALGSVIARAIESGKLAVGKAYEFTEQDMDSVRK
jgi:hypothetical protein